MNWYLGERAAEDPRVIRISVYSDNPAIFCKSVQDAFTHAGLDLLRDRFLPGEEVLHLGRRVHQIGTEQLRLNHTRLAVYAHRCGTALSGAEIDAQLYSSEGWFSAIYLNLRVLSEYDTPVFYARQTGTVSCPGECCGRRTFCPFAA